MSSAGSVRWGRAARAELESVSRARATTRRALPAPRIHGRAAELGLGRGAAPGGAAVVAGAMAARLRRRAAAGCSPRATALLPLRRAVAVRWPDLIKSNGGGANAILVGDGDIAEQRTQRLCLLPERRQLQAVRAEGRPLGRQPARHRARRRGGTTRGPGRPRRHVLGWAGGAPAVLGGDFNVRAFELPGTGLIGGHDVDYVFAAGLRPARQIRGARARHALRPRPGAGPACG